MNMTHSCSRIALKGMVLAACVLASSINYVGAVNRCGTSFATAGNQCSLCPQGVDSECGPGEHCYADLPDCSASGGGTPPSSPSGPIGETYATLNSEQKGNAHTIIQVGKDNNIPQRGWVVALATAMQESKLINLNYGDQDSQGLFQQRPSQGWGTIAQITNPVLSTQAFYGVSSHTSNPGLLQIKGWQQLTIGQACQAVQVSEFPDRYAQWEQLGDQLVANDG